MNNKISETKQFYSTKELNDAGFSYYKIQQMVHDGTFTKLNKSMYENVNFIGDTNDFSTVNAYIPKGVVCMLSAARYYNLTTFLPDAVDIAIERSMKVSTLPKWPSVNLWYFPSSRYSTGIEEIKNLEGNVKIYDVEKTVIDILYYRNKVGIDITKEVLINYLSRKDRDLNKLHQYACNLKCEKILNTYLEVLI